jgi:hypothetical protein
LKFINLTPHEIHFRSRDQRDWTLPPSGIVISARSQDKHFSYRSGKENNEIELVTSAFLPEPGELDKLLELERQLWEDGEDYLLIGSTLAAQAYPCRIVSLFPVKGLERVPTAQKVMRDDKFRIFPRV